MQKNNKEEAKKKKEIIELIVVAGGYGTSTSTNEVAVFPEGASGVIPVPGSPSVPSGDGDIDTNVLPQEISNNELRKSLLCVI